VSNDTKELIIAHLGVLKMTMKENGLIFGFAVNKEDGGKSKLLLVEKDKYLKTGEFSGIQIELENLNKGL
jgi:hypothetical protein